MKVVYNCHIPEVMGYANRGYCFRRGDEAFLIWEGYFSDLMAMWSVYWVNLTQVPLLGDWNDQRIADGPVSFKELPATVRAFRESVDELRKTGGMLDESPQHGDFLVNFLEEASEKGQSVSVEEWWG